MILSVMGRKGGITKTTVAKTLATALALKGKSVLLVDADGQGNACDGVGVQPDDSFYNLIVNDAEWSDVLRAVPANYYADDRMHYVVLPSFAAQRVIERDPRYVPVIYERFDEVRPHFDAIIIDTSPGITEIHAAMYYIADFVLLPTLCDYDSIMSLQNMFTYLERAANAGRKAGYEPADILGILPNKFDAREDVQKYNVGFLSGQYHKTHHTFKPVRDLTIWRKAAQYKESIYRLQVTGTYGERRDANRARREFQQVIERVEMVL